MQVRLQLYPSANAMISEQEALERVLAALSPAPVAEVVLAEAQGRFAGRSMRATIPLPGFNNSMMLTLVIRNSR